MKQKLNTVGAVLLIAAGMLCILYLIASMVANAQLSTDELQGEKTILVAEKLDLKASEVMHTEDQLRDTYYTSKGLYKVKFKLKGTKLVVKEALLVDERIKLDSATQ